MAQATASSSSVKSIAPNKFQYLGLCLIDALENENLHTLEMLLNKHKSNPNLIVDARGYAAVHLVCGLENRSFSLEAAKMIFDECGGDPNIPTFECMVTPMHIAAANGNAQVFQLMLKHGGNIEAEDTDGATPLVYAVREKCHYDVVMIAQNFLMEQKVERKRREAEERRFLSPAVHNRITMTPQGVPANLDPTSPFYINITHRRKMPGTPGKIPSISVTEMEDKENTPVTLKKVNLFELTHSNLEEYSRLFTRSSTKESFIDSWRAKVSMSSSRGSLTRNIEVMEKILFSFDDTSNTSDFFIANAGDASTDDSQLIRRLPRNSQEEDLQMRNAQMDELREENKSLKKRVEKLEMAMQQQQQQQQDVGKERLLKTTTVKDMLRAKRDNLRNMQQEAAADGVDLSSAPITSESSNECTAIEMASNGGVAMPAAEPELPTNLSEDLLKNIAHLKEAAKGCTSLGKSNFFDTKIKEVLLKVENATRLAGGQVRSQVYSYLEVHLPCSKDALMKRGTKMRIQQADARVERAVVELRRGIDEAMPGVMEAYKKEYERVMQLKNSKTIMGIPVKENDLKLPKKHFVWTDTTRGLLNTVVTTCRGAYSSVKWRKVTFDVYIVDYLTTKVLPIWPQGWMKIDNLLKEMDVKSAGKVSSTKEGSSSTSSEMKVPSASSLSIATNKNPSVANVVEKLDTKLPATPPVATTSFACSSSLTITPVSSTAAASKPLPSVQNKVTITNVDGMSGKVATASAGISSIISSTATSAATSTAVVKKPNSTVVTQQNVTIFEGFRSTTSETDSDTDSSTDCEIIENSPDAKKKASSGSLLLKTTSLLRPSKLSAGPSSAVAAAADAEMKRDLDFWRFCK